MGQKSRKVVRHDVAGVVCVGRGGVVHCKSMSMIMIMCNTGRCDESGGGVGVGCNIGTHNDCIICKVRICKI